MQATDWEKTFAKYNGLLSEDTKLLILTNKKTNNPVKIGPKTLTDTSANETNKHEKTLHILSHQGNAI